jgi:single-strand DNA-binding protein
MKSLNRVTLIGNLGQDPEIRYLDNGVAVGRFSLATTDSYRDKDGNWQDRPTEWHNIVVWRYLAERAEKDLKKGMTVYVEGEINYRTYQDKDGHEKKITDIIARNFKAFVDKRSSSDRDGMMPPAANDPFANRAQNNNNPPAAPQTNNTVNTSDNSDDGGDEMGDDLPF